MKPSIPVLPLCIVACLSLVAMLAEAADEVKLGSDDHGRTITVAPGQTLTVALPSNPSTGYNWSLLKNPNQAIIKNVSQVMEGPKEPIPGAGGQEHWKFEALVPGETRLVLVYKRAWEKLSKADQRFALILKVEQAPKAH